ncbi:unnamed protein product [Sphenostylis stenocarpa]|uniref:EF-hand domain-containing protein n=1 Tax=Sphenostylis stenocarpa TaxID=92480 RepID=A0AA86VW64_9FABA|nr:unnamed protein product [Sphenostylis stenocarpa]
MFSSTFSSLEDQYSEESTPSNIVIEDSCMKNVNYLDSDVDVIYKGLSSPLKWSLEMQFADCNVGENIEIYEFSQNSISITPTFCETSNLTSLTSNCALSLTVKDIIDLDIKFELDASLSTSTIVSTFCTSLPTSLSSYTLVSTFQGLKKPRFRSPPKIMESNQSAKETMVEVEFEDLLPVMAEKLDVEAFVSELCGGFKLLADPATALISGESLMRNSALLGMDGMSKEEAEAMVRQGDLDGDGKLNETEFCVLMIRLSPGIMEEAEAWLHKALQLDHTKSST